MSSINSDPIVVPAPRPVSDDRLLVNIPLATTDNAGVATYDKEQFNVLDGKVSLKRDYFRKNFNDKFDEYLTKYDEAAMTALEHADAANSARLAAESAGSDAIRAKIESENAKKVAVAAQYVASKAKDETLAAKDFAIDAKNLSKQWAVGVTSSGNPSDTNNSKYYAELARTYINNLHLGITSDEKTGKYTIIGDFCSSNIMPV